MERPLGTFSDAPTEPQHSGVTPQMTSLILLSVALFATTHIDDLLLLLGWFGDRSIPTIAIVGGQYIGVALLLLGGLLGAEAALVAPTKYLRLLGAVPLIMGFNKLFIIYKNRSRVMEETHLPRTRGRHIWDVAGLTLASGGDNLGVYLPFFATHSLRARAATVVVFLAMTGVWCVAAHWLAHHRLLNPIIEKWGARLLPLVLITLGVSILFSSL